nr:hypothetical protein [Klebsiella pneumoniae subsp. pneumoniae]
MTDITELAQRNELLIANGQQTADLLRHRQITKLILTISQLYLSAKATGKKLTLSYQSRSLPSVPLATLTRW